MAYITNHRSSYFLATFGHICTEICSVFCWSSDIKATHILNWPFCEQNDITKWAFHWEPSKFGKSNCPKHVCIAILNYWFRDVLNTCGQHTQNPGYIIFTVNFPRGFGPPARFPRATFKISIRWYTYTYPTLHGSQHHHHHPNVWHWAHGLEWTKCHSPCSNHDRSTNVVLCPDS